MPTHSCPNCHGPKPRLLTVLSEVSWDVDYYRCADCGHVWTVSKDGTRLVSHVTLLHEAVPPPRSEDP